MRYEDWDVLVFPSGEDFKLTAVPLKEFRVDCHVVPDMDIAHNQARHNLPVMTCFVPSLQPGIPFHISVHCWGDPGVTQYTQNYSKHCELVKFEARIMIDGRTIAYVDLVCPSSMMCKTLTSLPRFQSHMFRARG